VHVLAVPPSDQGDKVLHAICLSVPCLRFTQNRNAVKTSNLLET